MNPPTQIGMVVSTAFLAVALLFDVDDPKLFVDVPSLAIVLGGTLAATFLSYPLREVLRIFHLMGTVQSLVERGELEAWQTHGGHGRIATQSLHDGQARHGNQAAAGAGGDPLLRVLVVDDDLVTLEVVRAATDQWDLPLSCTLMSSAVDALLQIGTLRPHVLLTDLSMPGVDGFELLHSLRSNPAFASVLLVAITGLSEGEVKAKGGLPADTVLLKKPLDLRWLHGFLSALVATRQLKAAQI